MVFRRRHSPSHSDVVEHIRCPGRARPGQGSFFAASAFMRQDLSEVEAEARPVIARNIAALVADRGLCRVGDFPVQVFGDYLGRVRETVVRAAIKDLHASGRRRAMGRVTGSPI